MRVSVVIPCHNSSAHIVKTLESAVAQTRPPAEVICVDDASTDGTWELLQEFVSRHRGLVRIFHHSVRRGTPAAARNTAIAQAKGDWIAFLDHDDLWLPNKLERQAARLAQTPDAGVIHSDCWVQMGDDEATRTRMREQRTVPEGEIFRSLFHRNCVLCPTAMVKREWLAHVGPMNESAALAGVDDYDLWLRLARAGCKFAYVREPLAVWRRHEANLSNDQIHSLRGQIAVIQNLLSSEPQLKSLLSPAEIKSRLLTLRLDLARRLIKANDAPAAKWELTIAWTQGRWDPQMWALKWRLRRADLKSGSAARIIRKTMRKFQKRSRDFGHIKA